MNNALLIRLLKIVPGVALVAGVAAMLVANGIANGTLAPFFTLVNLTSARLSTSGP